VIDDIAFQTNLLALNAAAEAARASPSSPYAVRPLTQRSSEAARDISGLISSSNSEVGEGAKLARQTGEALSQMLGASQKVAATIAEISAASGEQAVAHLDEMNQQNAAFRTERRLPFPRIGQLNDLVAAFKTGPEGAGRTAANHPAPDTLQGRRRLAT